MSPVRHLEPRLASSIAAAPIRTLWRGRFIRGALNLVAGEPGAGKSSLIALIAAELAAEGERTIISNVEDDDATVTIPRLTVAGTRLDLVNVIPPDDAPVFPSEFEALEYVIERTRTACVVLDPIGAHFSPEHRCHHRPTLRKLAGIARRTDCAIVAVHHTTKAGEIGGPNSGLRGTCRAVYFYGFDPDDEDRRALSIDKVNGMSEPPALILEQEVVELRLGRTVVEAGKLKVVRDSNARASRRRGRRNEERDAACHAWLSEFLASGEDCARKSGEVYTAGQAEGYGQSTLTRAKVALRVEHVRRGYGGDGFWLWRLPDDHPLRLGIADAEDYDEAAVEDEPINEEPGTWSDHRGHAIELETGVDGEAVGARCTDCGVQLPAPQAALGLPASAPIPDAWRTNVTVNGVSVGEWSPVVDEDDLPF